MIGVTTLYKPCVLRGRETLYIRYFLTPFFLPFSLSFGLSERNGRRIFFKAFFGEMMTLAICGTLM